MFTGIIESLGKITRTQTKGNNRIFSISTSFTSAVKISDSVAINGCCLTVTDTQKDVFQVEAVSETLKMTNLLKVKAGDYVNLERARQISDRWEGHIVQGHIDEMAKITNIRKTPGLVTLEVELSRESSINIVDKGSITIDGISLTIAKIKDQKCSVNIVPFTFDHTNLNHKRISDWVNVEFDVIGKYVRKYLDERRSR